MRNRALTVILTEQRRRQCPRGATADPPFGLCRKCQGRSAWRCKTASTRRKSARRRVGHRVRKAALRFG